MEDLGADRARRAIGLMAVAAIATLLASMVYLRPSPSELTARSAAITSSSPSGFQLAPVLFGDAENGVIQYSGRSDARPGPIYATADGGRTWRVVRLTRDPSEAFVVMYQDRSDMVAVEVSPGPGHFLRSTDGGKSWQQLSDPRVSASDSIAPVFLDSRVGWWLDRPLPPPNPPSGQAVGLWHTTDGGQTWAWIAATGIPTEGTSSQIIFTDPLHGILVLSDRGGGDVAVRTEDGGATWQPAARFEPPVANLRSTSISLLRHGSVLLAWLAVRTADPDPTPLVFSSTSEDGGRTWTALRAGPALESPVEGHRPAIDGRGRLLMLDDRRLLASEDGGATWTARVVELPPGLWPLGIVSAVPGALYAIAIRASALDPVPRSSVEALLRSSDGGIRWTEVRLPLEAASN